MLSVALFRRVVGLGIVVVVCSAGPAQAQEDTAARARQLVQQLGAERFEQREHAAAELVRLGPAAREAVRQGLQSPDPEVRKRCRTILRLLEHHWLRQRLAQFLADPDAHDLDQLPGWKDFLQALGGDRKVALALYRKVAREQQALLLAWTNPQALQQTLRGLIRGAYLQARSGVMSQARQLSMAHVAGLFIATLHPEVKPGNEELLTLITLSYQIHFRQGVMEGTYAPALRHMLGQWLERYYAQMDAYRVLSWAMNYRLPAAILPAERILKGGGPNNHVVVQAMLAVARDGNRRHVPLVKRHFNNQAVVYQLRRRSNDILRVQVRDVALAVVIHLHGLDPKDFGFAERRTDATYVYAPVSLGFTKEEARAKAFQAWEQFERSGKADRVGKELPEKSQPKPLPPKPRPGRSLGRSRLRSQTDAL